MHLKFSSLQGLQATSNEEQRLLQGDHRTPCPMILNLKQKYASNDLAAIIQDPRRIDQTFTIGIPAAQDEIVPLQRLPRPSLSEKAKLFKYVRCKPYVWLCRKSTERKMITIVIMNISITITITIIIIISSYHHHHHHRHRHRHRHHHHGDPHEPRGIRSLMKISGS